MPYARNVNTKIPYADRMKQRWSHPASRSARRTCGYTLTELLIVLGIVTLLAFLLVPRLLG
jgi:prepilin-type N-terminal cleavage/methylation domain-containing protein